MIFFATVRTVDSVNCTRITVQLLAAGCGYQGWNILEAYPSVEVSDLGCLGSPFNLRTGASFCLQSAPMTLPAQESASSSLHFLLSKAATGPATEWRCLGSSDTVVCLLPGEYTLEVTDLWGLAYPMDPSKPFPPVYNPLGRTCEGKQMPPRGRVKGLRWSGKMHLMHNRSVP